MPDSKRIRLLKKVDQLDGHIHHSLECVHSLHAQFELAQTLGFDYSSYIEPLELMAVMLIQLDDFVEAFRSMI